MQLKQIPFLKPWQLAILFLSPIVGLIIFLILDQPEEGTIALSQFNVITFFISLSFLLISLWQYLLGWAYFQQSSNKGLLFKLNGGLAITTLSLILAYTFWCSLQYFSLTQPQNVQLASMGPVSRIIPSLSQLLILHALTSLLIQPSLIASDIRKGADLNQGGQIVSLYHKPMKKAGMSILILFGTFILFTLARDIVEIFAF